MPSLKTSIPKNRRGQKGFTLIEVIVVIGLISLVASILAFIDISAYTRSNLRSEQSLVVSLLHKARIQSLSNINQAPHGVYLAPAQYVIFQGPSYALRTTSADIVIPAATQLTHSGFSEVDFAQLTAEPTLTGGNSFFLTDGVHTASLSLNNEGRINW